MAGDTFGSIFRVSTAGESHGAGLLAIVEGCPPCLPLSEADLQGDLDRRRPGQSKLTSQRQEGDQVEILSGVFEGRTTGTPIGLLIRNTDQRSKDYGNLSETFRPGHADWGYWHKYGIRDHRGGGRSSARETAMRVAAGAIAKKFLGQYGVAIHAWVSAIGAARIAQVDLNRIGQNPLFCPDENAVAAMTAEVEAARNAGDSIGAELQVLATGMPVGLGEPVFDRLDADIAKALMGINAVKGVEIGDGFGVVGQRGSQHGDEITPEGFVGNHAGGVLGGISSGQDLLARLAIKPTSSIAIPRRSIDKQGHPIEVVTHGRHDPCVGIRAVPIAEAMVALVLMDHWLRHRAQTGRDPQSLAATLAGMGGG